MGYQAGSDRYESMQYRKCGKAGLKLPAVSLGMWHNFGGTDSLENGRAILRAAFDLGITHFDLANNYGPPPGSAEETMGILLKKDFLPYRDELVISSKAGYDMWPGPYGNWGSRKYLLSSLDQSLKRMGLEYVDIFYHHRMDPDTPLEETMGALAQAVRSGKALYVGLSNYSPERTREAAALLKAMGAPLLIHQPRYNMFERSVERGLLDALADVGAGCIAFMPLAQGLLTGRYFDGIPAQSRAGKDKRFLKPEDVTEEKIEKARRLDVVAQSRGQSLAQMAIAWTLRDDRVTSALIGASRPEQVAENAKAAAAARFTDAELAAIDKILA
jgi:L-glyceraldehyde 3-phosphate reductase